MRFENLNNLLKEDNFSSFNIDFLDSHIKNIALTCDASYAQISMASLVTFGFILAHGGIKNTSLYFCDLSNSGTGKSFNITLQMKLLLNHVEKLQENLQLTYDGDEIKRFHNIHRGKITVAALNQCIKTIRAQLFVIDELGLLMSKGSDIIDEITKLYGSEVTSLSVTKGEIPNSKNIVPVAFSFMGATTLSYFGGKKSVMKELLGGFINRQLLSYNTVLKKPEEINSIYKDILDYESSNKKAIELFDFAKKCNLVFKYSLESEELQLEFKKEVQYLKVKYHDMGTEFGNFYSRVEQNLQTIMNILHILKCFEQNNYQIEINVIITKTAIDFFKKVVFKVIDKLINYLSDGELLEREEKQLNKIKEFVTEYNNKHSSMPKIRDISLKTRLSKDEILTLTKGYLELTSGSTVFKYCDKF
jgi:hypothetical protein